MNELEEKIKAKKAVLEKAQQALSILEERIAGYGSLAVPVDLQIQLDDKRSEVKRLEQELADLEGQLPLTPPENPPPSPAAPLPFTNRQDEISRILSPYAPAYYIIDAPTGYGKTKLLLELERRFQADWWKCAYISVAETDTLESVIAELRTRLGAASPTMPEGVPQGLQLGLSLASQWTENPKNGVVWLIDLEKKPSLPLVQQIFTELIPAVDVCLRSLEFFRNKHNRFRVILAGRYIAMRPEVRKGDTPKTVLQLSPFDYEVVCDAVRDYLKGRASGVAEQLAAHIFFMTGGHPDCVTQVIQRYSQVVGYAPDTFVSLLGDQIWKEIVRPVALDLRDGLADSTKELYKVVGRLCVFRYVDYEILRHMKDEWKDIAIESEYDLADELTATYLLDWKDRVLRDDLARRILSIAAQREDPLDFARLSRQAQELCADRMRDPNTPRPEIWFIEFLYQELQQRAHQLSQSHAQQRQGMLYEFLNARLPQALTILLEERQVPSRSFHIEQSALAQALDKDWEFRFNLNYHLRGEQFNQDPYTALLNGIDNWFAAHKAPKEAHS
jgi:hypothetical protein